MHLQNIPSLVVFFLILTCIFPSSLMASDSVETAGTIIQVVVPAVAYSMTFVNDDEGGRMEFYKSFATTLATTYALKLTIDKKRPNGSSMSFPSGHTSAAFSGASFIQKRYGWEYGIPAYLAASFVGYSRIESDQHYIEDVLAGAAIGIISTYIFTDSYKETVVVVPFFGEKTAGLMLSGNF